MARLDAMGHVNWRLASVRLPTADVTTPLPLTSGDGKPAGAVTSSCESPAAGGALGLARIRSVAQPGEALESALGAVLVAPPQERGNG